MLNLVQHHFVSVVSTQLKYEETRPYFCGFGFNNIFESAVYTESHPCGWTMNIKQNRIGKWGQILALNGISLKTELKLTFF